ncbi:MAG: M48 family metalloprotease, partial [Okeania sp. SIO2H7]|nr:M48 family metalloprotease [Okeania sp. SIO2H7]
ADRGAELVKKGFPDRVPERAAKVLSYLIIGLRPVAAIISNLSYSFFWLMRWLVLWVSRRRVYYSDRFACDVTTNPNGLTRALLKIALGIAAEIKEKGQTTTFLEGFDLLLPVGVKQGMSIGSVGLHASFESILQWDIVNPYRQWLTVNNTHPLMGDRLQILSFYAKFWKLETELDWEGLSSKGQANSLKSDRQKLLILGAPFFGIPLGLVVALTFWLVGGIFYLLTWWQVDWLFGDFWLLAGCLPIGYSLGTIIRINRFFPDIRPLKILDDPSLPELLSSPEALPLDSQPVRLQGKLLGRSGMAGWLGQDLSIETKTGLVKLHYLSKLGPLGNLWPKSTRPCDLVGKSVTATGWWRRGATPWLDLDKLQAEGGKSIRSHHPIWSSIVAGVCALWGTYIIYRGSF